MNIFKNLNSYPISVSRKKKDPIFVHILIPNALNNYWRGSQ